MLILEAIPFPVSPEETVHTDSAAEVMVEVHDGVLDDCAIVKLDAAEAWIEGAPIEPACPAVVVVGAGAAVPGEGISRTSPTKSRFQSATLPVLAASRLARDTPKRDAML